MKTILLGIVFSCLTLSTFAQSIKVQTANTGTESDYSSGISRVYNNKVYTYSFQDKKIVITGFDVSTMKQTLKFSTESTNGLLKNGVLFLDNGLVILHEEKSSASTILGDVYSYDGKVMSKDKVLHHFTVLDNDGERRSEKDMVSENGKFFMLSSRLETGGFEYAMYDDNIKLVSKAVVKFPKEYSESVIQELLLSNTGNTGILVYERMEKSNFKYLKLNKGSKIVETVKTLASNYRPHESRVVMTSKGYYIGGFYGTEQERKIIKFKGTQIEQTVYGAFGLKLDPDNLNLVYDHFTEFSAEQAEAYNKEYDKNPNRTGTIEKFEFSRQRIFNFGYGFSQLVIDGMAVDKEGNIAMSLSSLEEPYSDGDKTLMNMIICQFKIGASGSINNFKIISKRQQTYGTIGSPDYFFSSLVCTPTAIVSIYNDDENNIDNLTNMNINISKADKKSLLVSAETKFDGTCKKYILLPADKNVLIRTVFTLYIDYNLSFAIATRDKGEVVLLKITSEG